MLYYEIKENPKSHHIKRFAMFGGEAAPGYRVAKSIIRLTYCLFPTKILKFKKKLFDF